MSEKFKRKKIVWFVVLLAVILFVHAQETSEVFELRFNVQGDKIEFVSISKTVAALPEYEGIKAADNRFEILAGREILYSSFFPIPKMIEVTDSPGYEFNINVPFNEQASSIVIYDKDNNELFNIPTKDPSENPEPTINQDNSVINQDNRIWVVYLIVLALLLFLVFMIIKKRKKSLTSNNSNQAQQHILIKNYILINLEKGFSKEQIKNALLKKHPLEQIDYVFSTIK